MGKWTDDIYGFWVFWGSLGENMKGGEGPGQKGLSIYEIFTVEFTAFSQPTGVNAGVREWPDNIYGFSVVWGSLLRHMKGGGGPGRIRPFICEIFTPEFTPNRLQKRV